MNSKQLTFKKERPLVLGEHTPLSIAQSSGKWKNIPYLKDNKGMLPPNMIVVGDRRRVLSATKHLFKPVMLQLETAMDSGNGQTGSMKRLKNIKSGIEKSLAIERKYKDKYFANVGSEMAINLHVKILAILDTALKAKENCEIIDQFGVANKILEAHREVTLESTTKTILQNIIHELFAPAGRVDAAVGLYIHNDKPIPITILETQMGMSAQDINAWEQLVGSFETGYMIGDHAIPAKSLNVIRAGTCGGIIISKEGRQLEEPFLTIGDVIIASSSIADGATVRQRAGFWSAFDQKEMDGFRQFWAQNGLEFTEDGLWPVIHSSRQTIDVLDTSCQELNLRIHHGANMSKDSLYMEGNEERTMDLRRLYNCLSTEMEHFGLAYLTHELTKAGIPATNGLVSTVVGTVPGGSFAEPGSVEEKTANQTQSTMLEAVMRSLWKMTYES